MCFAAKQPKVDARYYIPSSNNVRSEEFLISQREAYQKVLEWRKQRLLKKAYEQRKQALKANMLNTIENLFNEMDFPTNAEQQLGLLITTIEEMVIRECVHLALMN